MNTLPCGQCQNYHPQERGSSKGLQLITSYALCKAKTVYAEGASNVPEDAKTTKEPISKPCVVKQDMVVAHCEFARPA